MLRSWLGLYSFNIQRVFKIFPNFYDESNDKELMLGLKADNGNILSYVVIMDNCDNSNEGGLDPFLVKLKRTVLYQNLIEIPWSVRFIEDSTQWSRLDDGIL